GMKTFAARIVAWQQKALREAKLRSDWSAPDEAYERLTAEFVTRLLAEPSAQLAEIAQFARRIAPPGAVNGLGQALTKLTAPGVADIYQGTEYWDFSLVDPDNRAAVDFAARQRSLSAAPLAALVDAWPDGRIKQFLIARVLAVRQKMPELFAGGEYLPLAIEGARCGHIVAFARILADSISITVLCRHPARLLRGEWTVGMANTSWQDTRVVLPSAIRPAGFLDALTGNQISSADGCVQIARVLSILPVALLTMLRP
ncbi:MAG: malto-oligosyltrehalose synthase, partial [Xanthobacteraceae bacterium]